MRWTEGNPSLADVVPQAVAVPAPRILTDNASDTLRGIALAMLAYLIWTLGDATAKLGAARCWRRRRDAVAGVVRHGHSGGGDGRSAFRHRLATSGAEALGHGAGAQRAVVVRFGVLVHLLAVDEPRRYLCGGLHRAVDHDAAGGADVGRADPLAAGALHAGGLWRGADHAASRRRSVDTGRGPAAGRHAGDGADAHHDAAVDHHRDAGVPGVLAADLPHGDRVRAAVDVPRFRGRSAPPAGWRWCSSACRAGWRIACSRAATRWRRSRRWRPTNTRCCRGGWLAGFLVFGDLPSWNTLVGAVVVAASGTYNVYRERVRRAEERAAAA